MPNLSIILFELLRAYSFINALKKMVIPAINAETHIDIIDAKLSYDMLFVIAITMQAPPAPHSVLQISPTTSPQNEQTFSQFSQS